MNQKLKKIYNYIKPYNGIVYFMILLFSTHFLWKFVVDGDLNSQQIAILGKDFTNQFYCLSRFTAKIVYGFVRLFPGTDTFRVEDTILFFTDGKMKLMIIWGCTSVKQLYIFTVILLFYSGPFLKKLWYIPLGCVILFVYNIIRMAAICGLTRHHPEWFDSLHEGVFRYIFYGIIFLLWLIWEEKISKKNKKELV